MKLSDMKPLDEVIEEHREDPEFRTEWDRLAFAREVANHVVAYRTQHGLSQRDLAAAVGLAQPQIARLEKAEHQPSFDTLAKLTQATGLTFRFQVTNGAIELLSA
jgi:ribosome-binding protein aMBF1 (putative translation factor)